MPTEELEQALARAKWGNAEADIVEVVSRLLDLDRATVLRVKFALEQTRKMGVTQQSLDPADEMPEELCNAIKAQLRRGIARMFVRQAIETDGFMYVSTNKLVKRQEDVCNGCPHSFECVTHNFTTPSMCFKEGVPAKVERGEAPNYTWKVTRLFKGGAIVHPTKIRGDQVTVECAHPRGVFIVDAEDLRA